MPPAQLPDRDLDPLGSEARWKRAVMLFNQGRWELAMVELRELLSTDAQHVYANGLLAKALAALGHHDAALHQARQTVALAPDDAYSHDALAQVWMLCSD